MKFSDKDMAGNAKNVTNADFVVVDGILKEYKGKPVDVIIPDDVTSIGAEGFEYRTDLTNITIPSSVKSIDREAFEGCYKLIEVCNKSDLEIGSCGYLSSYAKHIITDEKDSYLTATADGFIFYEDGTNSFLMGHLAPETELILPQKSPTGNDYGIYDCAFSDCTCLTSITIPSSVTSIGDCAFYGCTGLTSITIPASVTSIGSRAFNGCTNLTSITIPSSVTSIGDCAFSDCTCLTSITIPNSVTSIGDWVFDGCTNLTSITIPSSFTSIGEWAFDGCEGLTNITFEGTKEQWNALGMANWFDYSKTTVHCIDD